MSIMYKKDISPGLKCNFFHCIKNRKYLVFYRSQKERGQIELWGLFLKKKKKQRKSAKLPRSRNLQLTFCSWWKSWSWSLSGSQPYGWSIGHRISLEVRVVMSVIVMVSQLQSSLSRKAFSLCQNSQQGELQPNQKSLTASLSEWVTLSGQLKERLDGWI